MTSGNELTHAPDLSELAMRAVAGMPSPHTRRVYARRLQDYLAHIAPDMSITRSGVQSYIIHLRDKGAGDASINQSLSAIKILVSELGERILLDRTTVESVMSIKGVKRLGVRAGNWLTIEQVRRVIDMPDARTLVGQRDRALLAVLIGCGLRRSEAAGLTWDKVVRRWDRWVLADIRGKRGRVRSVGVPEWVARELEAWRKVNEKCHSDVGQGINNNRRCVDLAYRAEPGQDVLRDSSRTMGTSEGRASTGTAMQSVSIGASDDSINVNYLLNNKSIEPDESPSIYLLNRSDVSCADNLLNKQTESNGSPRATSDPNTSPVVSYVFGSISSNQIVATLSASGIWWIVKGYAERLNLPELAPHDLRRTFAALARDGGASIEQIQRELGHASVQTTEIYLQTLIGLKPGRSAGDFIQV